MASLWKQARSKYWTACFTAADGRQLKRTTKETDKRKARIIAEAWEQAESLGSAGLLTSREQLRIILEQTYQRLTGEKLDSVTLKEWLMRWLKAEIGPFSRGRQGLFFRGTAELAASLPVGSPVWLVAESKSNRPDPGGAGSGLMGT